LAVALDKISDAKDKTWMTLGGIEFLKKTGQFARADQLVTELLQDAKMNKSPALWRMAAELAQKRDMTARSLECLENALEREFTNLPEVIDLQQVRKDYARVLEYYQGLADAMVALKLKPPPGFLTRVVRTADRWRALDREATSACQIAAAILRRFNERDLAWDYLTTPIGLSPNESAPWLQLAGAMNRTGELDLADRAYLSAFETEPTNAQILWDRAQNLRQAGKTSAARGVLQQIVDGTWQPRFQSLQAQAKLQMQE
jgi:tetratricopeptide (TPR) repeat protein